MRERESQGREKKEEGGRGGEAEVRREGKARQGKDFLGKKQSLAKESQKQLTTIFRDPYNSSLLSGSTSFLEAHIFRFIILCPS